MIPLVCIYIGGILTLLLAIFHTQFYRLFTWADDFNKITIPNQKILYTIHLALLLIFFMIGILSIAYGKELSQSIGLSFGFNLFYSFFWIWRLIWQFLYFKKAKGKSIPPIGIFLIFLFALLSVAYLVPVLYRIL